jgi:hypothetical protein
MPRLRYVIKFVADMDKAVKFHRDVLVLQLKFKASGWSQFATGETTLALHPASDKNPAGKVELGFTVADVEAFYRDMSAKGALFNTCVKRATRKHETPRLRPRPRRPRSVIAGNRYGDNFRMS